MAIYHFSAKVISRATGRSAVAAAAYRSGSELYDQRLGRPHNYSDKTGVVHSEIMMPEGSPEAWRDRETLWNTVEAGEKRKDAQLAREVEFSIPREMSQADGVALAQEFVQREFVDRGMVADLNVHWDHAPDGSPKPHAHVMLSMRELVPGDEGEGGPGATGVPGTFGKKVRDWNATSELEGWRERWADHVNGRLAELGIDARIDHRSLEDQGVDLEPQNKIGPVGQRREERGEASERADDHRAIARRNGERIAAEPAVALDALTRQSSTFTARDLQTFVFRHTDGADQFRDVLAKVQASPEIVRLGEDGKGRERFTSREMLAVEASLERSADALANGHGHQVSAEAEQGAVAAGAERGLSLGGEQGDALRHVLDEKDLVLVVGYAGTGKSAMLGVAREAWEASGYNVRGAALSGIAAENLEGGSGIGSRTIASLEHAWKQGRDELQAGDVLVVDEAGMVGSRQMERVLSAANDAGAKVVLIGDPEQLQAIEAGAAFRALAQRHGAAEITEVRRQADGWQRDATRELANGRTGEALDRYDAAGMVKDHDTRDEAKASLVEGWQAERTAEPDKSRVILAHTRADVADLNQLARSALKEAGQLGEDHAVQTERGERTFAPGDRVMFLRNERSMGVKNGTLGTVESIEGSGMAVALNGPGDRRVSFDTKDYADIDHGYAATVHKAQGVTTDRAHVLATPTMDRHMAYVALTRHREGVAMHYGKDDFAGGREDLVKALGRERAKDTTLDYAEAFAARRDIATDQTKVRTQGKERERVRSGTVKIDRKDGKSRLETPAKSRFSGLKLGAGRSQPQAAAKGVGSRLEQAVTRYTEAWRDAARMKAENLPVLPHQEQALKRAATELDGQRPNGAADLAAALNRTPGLDSTIGKGDAGQGVAAMNAAGQARAQGIRPPEIGRPEPGMER